MFTLSTLLYLSSCGTPTDTALASAGDDADTQTIDRTDSSDELNVMIIMVDTLRADHMELYGYERETTPNLSNWAADELVFDAMVAQAGFTIASVSSLFTSLLPSGHGCCVSNVEGETDNVGMEDLLEGVDTIAEAFQGADYRTASLFKTGVFEREGVDQGFNLFWQIPGDARSGESGAELTDEAVEWLTANAWGDKPFFLYLHYMDPHAEYQAPEPWYEMFDEGYDSELTGGEEELALVAQDPNTDDIERLKALYDGEIAYLDSEIARLLAFVEAQELDEDTVVVFVADHGEQFFEHGGMNHSELFQEIIHAPLIVHVPGVEGRRIDVPVQMIDVAPTLAALAGVQAPESWTGRDLSGLLRGESSPEPTYILSEYNQRSALISPEGLKFIRSQTRDRLFDLSADPGELEDLYESRPEDAAVMGMILDEMLAEAKERFDRLRE